MGSGQWQIWRDGRELVSRYPASWNRAHWCKFVMEYISYLPVSFVICEM
jgi:hypothetical protein